MVDLDVKELPMRHSENISVIISDSGVTRYRLEAGVWDIYSSDTMIWHFPDSIYVERFDLQLEPEGFLRADSAYYYDKSGLWKAMGNVHVESLEGMIVDTQLLYWNQKAKADDPNAIFTDEDVSVVREGEVSHHKGLRSNTSMTEFILLGSRIERDLPAESSSPNDSINTPQDVAVD